MWDVDEEESERARIDMARERVAMALDRRVCERSGTTAIAAVNWGAAAAMASLMVVLPFVMGAGDAMPKIEVEASVVTWRRAADPNPPLDHQSSPSSTSLFVLTASSTSSLINFASYAATVGIHLADGFDPWSRRGDSHLRSQSFSSRRTRGSVLVLAIIYFTSFFRQQTCH
jgi:hypothetical protein